MEKIRLEVRVDKALLARLKEKRRAESPHLSFTAFVVGILMEAAKK